MMQLIKRMTTFADTRTPSLPLSSPAVQSMTSTLYNDDEKYLKVFCLTNAVSKSLFQAELEAYHVISKIHTLHQYVPKLLGWTKNSILMENRGMDGICIVNSAPGRFSFDMWRRYLADTSAALRILHANGLVHGDVKPENSAYDFATKRWSLIDFGFMLGKRAGFVRRVGTVPYCSPHNSVQYILARTIQASGVERLDVVNDIYSFALSALTFFGYAFELDDNPYVELDIIPLVQIHNKDLKALQKSCMPRDATVSDWVVQVLHLLAAMALTQLDTSCATAVWDKQKCACFFKGHNSVPCALASDSIFYYWDQLATIITNRSA